MGFQATVNICMICDDVLSILIAAQIFANHTMLLRPWLTKRVCNPLKQKASAIQSPQDSFRGGWDLKNSPFHPNSPLSALILLNAVIYPAAVQLPAKSKSNTIHYQLAPSTFAGKFLKLWKTHTVSQKQTEPAHNTLKLKFLFHRWSNKHHFRKHAHLMPLLAVSLTTEAHRPGSGV